MSYRNKTYTIFDGDNDMWAFAYMKGWKTNDRIDFDFHDAHDIRPLTDRASEGTVKQRLRERMANTKQAIVLIGDTTKNLYKFVRWEIELCVDGDIPIIAVNLNGDREYDSVRCPVLLRGQYVVHVSFQMKIIQYALDHFPTEYRNRPRDAAGNRHYSTEHYKALGL